MVFVVSRMCMNSAAESHLFRHKQAGVRVLSARSFLFQDGASIELALG
jgi:hypothetical protein